MVRLLLGCRTEICLCYLAGVVQVSEEQVRAVPGIQEPPLLLPTRSGNLSTSHIYSLHSSHHFTEVGLGKEMQVLQTTRCLDSTPERGTSQERTYSHHSEYETRWYHPRADVLKRESSQPDGFSRYLQESGVLPPEAVVSGWVKVWAAPWSPLVCVCSSVGSSRAWSEEGQGLRSCLPRCCHGQIPLPLIQMCLWQLCPRRERRCASHRLEVIVFAGPFPSGAPQLFLSLQGKNGFLVLSVPQLLVGDAHMHQN